MPQRQGDYVTKAELGLAINRFAKKNGAAKKFLEISELDAFLGGCGRTQITSFYIAQDRQINLQNRIIKVFIRIQKGRQPHSRKVPKCERRRFGENARTSPLLAQVRAVEARRLEFCHSLLYAWPVYIHLEALFITFSAILRSGEDLGAPNFVFFSTSDIPTLSHLRFCQREPYSTMSVYAIGNGKANGELGTGNYEEKLDPVLLESIKGRVVELKACESNALAITGTS